MFIHFFCLCPLGLTIKLYFDISKVCLYEFPCASVSKRVFVQKWKFDLHEREHVAAILNGFDTRQKPTRKWDFSRSQTELNLQN